MQTYGHDQGMDLKSIKMLSMQVLPVDNSTANSTAVQSSGGGGGGLDLATIGKGIGAVPLQHHVMLRNSLMRFSQTISLYESQAMASFHPFRKHTRFSHAETNATMLLPRRCMHAHHDCTWHARHALHEASGIGIACL